MRRSLAPSVLKQRALEGPGAASSSSSCGVGQSAGGKKTRSGNGNGEGDMVIERMPLFDFLTIPDDLKKKFNVPKGCVVTAE